ncbi:hypothetical protein [Reinekea sp.]|uniref:hypothetical protein n=1 Tax=Reinekea sp. TaxID=1970455 RepID=UPI00398A1CD9
MNIDTVLQKTETGRAAIADRSQNLSMKQRQLLIMIDGKKRLKDIVPNISDEVLARVRVLAEEGLVSGDFDAEQIAAPILTGEVEIDTLTDDVASHAALAGLWVTKMPAAQQLTHIRRVLAMCSQQYLDDELDTMLIDMFDSLSTTDQLQFCLDQWLKRMQSKQPESIVNMYINQLKVFVA